LYINVIWGRRDRIVEFTTPVSSTNKTDRHIITDILLKVALNVITTKNIVIVITLHHRVM